MILVSVPKRDNKLKAGKKRRLVNVDNILTIDDEGEAGFRAVMPGGMMIRHLTLDDVLLLYQADQKAVIDVEELFRLFRSGQ